VDMIVDMDDKALITKIRRYVAEHICDFHEARLRVLENLKLDNVLKSKNPYMFKAKNLEKAHDIVSTIVDAFLSSSEETIFGDWMENLAIFISGEVYGGKKSSAHGIDLEFDKDGVHYIVSIKSGPNWANSSQLAKMRNDFKAAAKTLRTSRSNLNVVAVNGICYGRKRNNDQGDYFRYCGQDFWEFVSGESDLYIEIIEPLAVDARKRNEEFLIEYDKKINIFVADFLKKYSRSDGSVDWEKIVRMNSGSVEK